MLIPKHRFVIFLLILFWDGAFFSGAVFSDNWQPEASRAVLTFFINGVGLWFLAFFTYTPDSPWAAQWWFMDRLGQDTPIHPVVTNDSMLYAVLMMEKLGKTLVAFADTSTIARLPEDNNSELHINSLSAKQDVMSKIQGNGFAIIQQSAAIKDIISGWADDDDFTYHLPHDKAVAVLEAVSHLTVVTCGFSLSAGLPGDDGHAELVASNETMTNPDTQSIEVDANKRCVRGVNYVAPDFASLITTPSLT